jgi:hypothetical protein
MYLVGLVRMFEHDSMRLLQPQLVLENAISEVVGTGSLK